MLSKIFLFIAFSGAGAVATAANTLSVTTYAPALAIGASYTLTFAVWKMN